MDNKLWVLCLVVGIISLSVFTFTLEHKEDYVRTREVVINNEDIRAISEGTIYTTNSTYSGYSDTRSEGNKTVLIYKHSEPVYFWTVLISAVVGIISLGLFFGEGIERVLNRHKTEEDDEEVDEADVEGFSREQAIDYIVDSLEYLDDRKIRVLYELIKSYEDD